MACKENSGGGGVQPQRIGQRNARQDPKRLAKRVQGLGFKYLRRFMKVSPCCNMSDGRNKPEKMQKMQSEDLELAKVVKGLGFRVLV